MSVMQIEIAEGERGGQSIVWIDSFLSNLATQLPSKMKTSTLRGHLPWYYTQTPFPPPSYPILRTYRFTRTSQPLTHGLQSY